MKQSIHPGLVSGSFMMLIITLAQFLQYQMRTTLGLPESEALFDLCFVSPMLSGLIGIVVGLMVLPWRRPKSKTFRLVGWIVFFLAEAVGIWIFISLCRTYLGISLNWPLFLASLYLPAAAFFAYLGFRLGLYVEKKMSDEKAAKIIKPASIVLFILTFIVDIAMVFIIRSFS